MIDGFVPEILASLPVSKEAIQDMLAKIDEAVSREEQADIPLGHYFSKGVYAREMSLLAGTMVVGKIHKFQNLNIISKGKVSVLSIDGIVHAEAPHTFVSQAGAKRLIFAHSDTVWTTILGTDLKDPEEIEKEFIARTYMEVGE